MNCVISFNRNSINIYRFTEKKKVFTLGQILTIEDVNIKELIDNPENLKHFLSQYIQEKKEKFYVLVDGMDIQYKVSPYINMELSSDMDAKNKEDTILLAAKMNLPKETALLHAGYTTCIMTATTMDMGYFVSAAFIPSEYLSHIRFAFQDLNLNLMGIYPKPFGLFNAINKGPTQLFTVVDELNISAFTTNGIYVWPKPAGCQFTEQDLLNNIVEEIKKNCNVKDFEIRNIANSTYSDYLKSSFDTENSNKKLDLNAVYAFGVLLPYSVDTDSSKGEEETESNDYENHGGIKGVLANVTNQLRQLLHFGRSEDSEV